MRPDRQPAIRQAGARMTDVTGRPAGPVRNVGADVAVSLHVYGADITRLGSSVRRTYDLPVGPAVVT